MTEFPTTQTQFQLPGPAGSLDVIATPHDNPIGIAIICHPLPTEGGTMHNKVVTTLARVFKDLGCHTVRFNFREQFDNGKGETDDAMAIVNWTKQVCPALDLFLAGFSFGSYVATNVATQVPPKQLITVAPAVTKWDFTELTPITCPWTVVQGEQDEIVSPQAVYDWVKNNPSQPTLIKLPETSHFFHGKLVELRELLVAHLQKANPHDG